MPRASANRPTPAYNKEDYRSAIELYRSSIENEGRSSDIYYNLANAYYRADKLGMAVVNYERAPKSSTRLIPTPAPILNLCEAVFRIARRTIRHFVECASLAPFVDEG